MNTQPPATMNAAHAPCFFCGAPHPETECTAIAQLVGKAPTLLAQRNELRDALKVLLNATNRIDAYEDTLSQAERQARLALANAQKP